jgi:hypothetical protein
MSNKMKLRAAALMIGTATSLATLAPAYAQTSQDQEILLLRQQLLEMTKRLERLEQQQTVTAEKVEQTRSEPVRTKPTTPGAFIIPGTDTELSIGGFIQADLIYDLDESTGDLFLPASLSVSDSDDEERFRAHARTSRLSVKTKTPSEYGDVKTLLEGDFFGGGGNEVSSNSSSFRLRHAYAEVGNFGAGQTWSNFMHLEAYPSTLDFQGPSGLQFVRQVQARYTHPVDDTISVIGSLENSELFARVEGEAAPISESTNFGIRAGLDKAPDAVLAVKYKDDNTSVKAAGIVRYLSAPNGGDSTLGWGASVTAAADVWEGGKVMAGVNYGEGIGRYLLNSGGGPDAFIDASGDIEAVEQYGAYAGISQAVTPSVTASLLYGRYQALDTFQPTDLETTQTVHATVSWAATDRVSVGGEVIYGTRENANGDEDDALRLQSAVKVNF